MTEIRERERTPPAPVDLTPLARAEAGVIRAANQVKQIARAETVDHPQHYNSHPAGIECIDVVEHMGFNLGNAIKYIWRADEKGNAMEDLRKALWYLKREIAKREKGDSAP